MSMMRCRRPIIYFKHSEIQSLKSKNAICTWFKVLLSVNEPEVTRHVYDYEYVVSAGSVVSIMSTQSANEPVLIYH